MKRNICTFLFCVLTTALWAQFSIQDAKHVGVEQAAIDTVFVLDDVTSAKLIYTDTLAHKYTWYAYQLGASEAEKLQEEAGVESTAVPLLDAASMGYQLQIDDTYSKWVWIFNYDNIAVSLENIQVYSDLEDRCSNYQIELTYQAPALQYDTLMHDKAPFEVQRQMVLSYDSTYYESGNYVTKQVADTMELAPNITVPSPLDNMAYVVSADTWGIAFDKAQTIESEVVEAFAVEVHLEASVRVREDAVNEGDKDISKDQKLAGSAPLNIEILNYASPAAFFYQWCLSSDKTFENCTIHSSETDFRYTFEKQGTYYLQLEATNNSDSDLPEKNCLSKQSYTIEVVNSLLEVPNVFTPNGDGRNDEFKVSYKSLVSFSGKVFGASGRLVYAWTDPAKGWDGTIGGVPAAEGAYYYYIEAVGADNDEDGKPMKYVYKGDINLIR